MIASTSWGVNHSARPEELTAKIIPPSNSCRATGAEQSKWSRERRMSGLQRFKAGPDGETKLRYPDCKASLLG
ncbi:MAG: hypothetical protein SynsKO_05580 [Synoicihabitans sp.]